MADTDRQHWVTVAEAAALLGRSERTIWRYVKRGELEIDRSQTPHLVDVGGRDIDIDTDSDSDITDNRDTKRSPRASMIDKLKAENERLRSELEHRDELLARLDREHNRLWQAHAQALRALPEPEAQEESEPESTPWWGRLWPWASGSEE